MKIKEIRKTVIHYIDIIENDNLSHEYRRVNDDVWEKRYGESFETIHYCEELEELFDNYMNQSEYQNNNIDPYSNSIKYNDNEIIKGNEKKPCFVCKKLTKWVDINFETHICSPICSDKLSEDFKRDYNKC